MHSPYEYSDDFPGHHHLPQCWAQNLQWNGFSRDVSYLQTRHRHQAVSNYEFWLIFVPEVCGRALTPLISQLPRWGAADPVSSVWSCLDQLGDAPRWSPGLIYLGDNLSSASGDCLFRGNPWFICQRDQAADSWWDWQELMCSWTWDLCSLRTSCAWGNSLHKRSFGLLNSSLPATLFFF